MYVVERVSNNTYIIGGEHCWESNVILRVVHVSKTAPPSVLFLTPQALVHTPVKIHTPVKNNLSTISEVVDTVGPDNHYLQCWVYNIVIVCNWAYGHNTLVYIHSQECGAVLVFITC